MLNDYNLLAKEYQHTNVKPDKLYSTLPTVLEMTGDLVGKTVLDLGCGAGFFTIALTQAGASKVIGIDNSVEQIELAKQNRVPNTEYLAGDLFSYGLPRADVVLAAYVLNYAETGEKLERLFLKVFDLLEAQGRMVGVVDLPTGKNLKTFGAVKIIQGEKKDEAPIDIQLYDKDSFICALHAIYFTPETIEASLRKAGFNEVNWFKPIVSEEGRTSHPDMDWEEYLRDPELGYFVATK